MGGILGGGKAPSPPPLPPPAPMPLPEDTEATQAARRRKIAETQQRSGRMSTILSEGGNVEKLGA